MEAARSQIIVCNFQPFSVTVAHSTQKGKKGKLSQTLNVSEFHLFVEKKKTIRVFSLHTLTHTHSKSIVLTEIHTTSSPNMNPFVSLQHLSMMLRRLLHC